jgi:hypothetical protein
LRLDGRLNGLDRPFKHCMKPIASGLDHMSMMRMDCIPQNLIMMSQGRLHFHWVLFP